MKRSHVALRLGSYGTSKQQLVGTRNKGLQLSRGAWKGMKGRGWCLGGGRSFPNIKPSIG